MNEADANTPLTSQQAATYCVLRGGELWKDNDGTWLLVVDGRTSWVFTLDMEHLRNAFSRIPGTVRDADSLRRNYPALRRVEL